MASHRGFPLVYLFEHNINDLFHLAKITIRSDDVNDMILWMVLIFMSMIVLYSIIALYLVGNLITLMHLYEIQ